MLSDKRNTVIKVNRIAKTALDVFADILEKEKLDRNDLELIIDRVKIFEDHMEVRLQRDIDCLLRCRTLGNAANFNSDIENILHCRLVQSAGKRTDKVFDVHVIGDGDPLEIFTSNDGEVIFKKYSPIGELSSFAGQYAEILHKTSTKPVVVCDRDHVISVSGVPKKELLERRISPALEDLVEQRRSYIFSRSKEQPLYPVEGVERVALVAYPIISAGDVCGAILFLAEGEETEPTEAEEKLLQAAAGFLGKQMEE